MAKRRRSKGLSGSPEHHGREAIKASEMSAEAYEKAAMFAARGECGAAFANFHRGGFDQGIMAAHQLEEGSNVPVGTRKFVVKAFEKANEAVRKACMMGSGSKLSGMRRKARRSRR